AGGAEDNDADQRSKTEARCKSHHYSSQCRERIWIDTDANQVLGRNIEEPYQKQRQDRRRDHGKRGKALVGGPDRLACHPQVERRTETSQQKLKDPKVRREVHQPDEKSEVLYCDRSKIFAGGTVYVCSHEAECTN